MICTLKKNDRQKSDQGLNDATVDMWDKSLELFGSRKKQK